MEINVSVSTGGYQGLVLVVGPWSHVELAVTSPARHPLVWLPKYVEEKLKTLKEQRIEEKRARDKCGKKQVSAGADLPCCLQKAQGGAVLVMGAAAWRESPEQGGKCEQE